MTGTRKYSYLFTWITAGCIAALTLLPAPAPTQAPLFNIPYIDKVIHFVLFGSLAAIWLWEFCYKHGFKKVPMRALWVIAAIVIILGGLDEVLQGFITADRTADVWDWAADALGAVTVPLLFRRIISHHLPEHAVGMFELRNPRIIPSFLKRLYMESFPPEERRDWNDIVRMAADRNHPLHLMVVTYEGKTVGMLTWWGFNGFRYVEHFAVSPEIRGHGIGQKAIEAFAGRDQSTVILEVEPEDSGEMARRRIGFYNRCGFKLHDDYEYIQPPYGPGLSEIPLKLMTAGDKAITKEDLKLMDRTLKEMVYGVKY